MGIFKAYHKYLALLLCVAILISIFALLGQGAFTQKADAADQINVQESSEDKKTASEISNMTGVSVDNIMELRKQGKTWNEILESYKGTATKSDGYNTDQRKEMLTSAGLSGEHYQSLLKEGFSEEEIMNAKVLAERIAFQLEEIISEDNSSISIPTAEIDNTLNDDTLEFEALAEAFDVNSCVYFILKLRAEFDTSEGVVNEYLYAIQLDIDFEIYLTDKEKYLEQKEEKIYGINLAQVINIHRIEERMLSKIQNKAGADVNNSIKDNINDISNGSQIKSTQIPEIPQAQIDTIKPRNPAEEILDEIRVIDPMKD